MGRATRSAWQASRARRRHRAWPSVTTSASRSDTGTLGERWNGLRWSLMNTPNPGSSVEPHLNSVSCTSPTACMAVGHYYSSPAGSATHHLALVERWNGRVWSIENTPEPSGAVSSFLNAVSCTARLACTAVGTYDLGHGHHAPWAERWNGRRWSLSDVPAPAGSSESRLAAVSCSGESACTAVGSRGYTAPLAERYS